MGERGAEADARAVQKDSKIIAVDLEFAADLVFVLFVEENASEELPVFFVHFPEDAAHQFAALAGGELFHRAGTRIDDIGGVFRHLRLASMRAQKFERDIVADGMNEAGQAGWAIERFAGTEVAENAEEGLLAGVLNEFGGAEARAQLELHGSGKVRDQKVLGIGIPVPERAQVVLVEQWLGHSAMDRAYQMEGGLRRSGVQGRHGTEFDRNCTYYCA